MAERARRWRLRAGLVLITAGLVVLGYVAWQLFGTNIVAHRHRDQVLGELHRAWRGGDAEVRTGRGTTRAQIRIPRFGADYEVPVLEGTSSAVLSTGFGHFTATAGPGEVGNFAVAAHRITHGQPLRHMPDLRKGDLVHVDTARTTYTYRLVTAGDDLVVPFTAGWVLDPLPTNPDGGTQPPQEAGQALITLTTCSELFRTDDRMVAFGVLVGSSPRK
jgi:sortase A